MERMVKSQALRTSTRRSEGQLSPISRRETAQFLSEMTLELRNLARGHHMTSLQGLLEVAYYEASLFATEIELPEDEIEHLRELARAAG